MSQYVKSYKIRTNSHGHRNVCPQGIYSILLGPFSKIVVYSPLLIKQLEEQRDAIDPGPSVIRTLQHAWGLPSKHGEAAGEILSQVLSRIQTLFDQQGPEILATTIRKLEQRMPNFITFMGSPIDQEYWERISGTVLLDDGETVETNFITLIQVFLTFLTTEVLLSPDLLEQQPALVSLLMVFPSHLENLLLRPKIFSPKSHAVVRTLLINAQPFLDEVFPSKRKSPVYSEVSDLSTPLLSALRIPSIQSSDADIQSSISLYILSLSLIPHSIVPWAILQVLAPSSTLYVDKKAVLQAAEEKVTVTQEDGIGGISPPPDVHIGIGTKSAVSTLLTDTLNIFARGWNEYTITKDIVLKDEPPIDRLGPKKSDDWHLIKGERVIAAHWLVDTCESLARGTERVDGGVEQALTKRKIYHKVVCFFLLTCFVTVGFLQIPAFSSYLAAVYPAFVATLFKLYSIEPVESSDWKLPKSKFAPGIALPTEDVRVRIRWRSVRDLNAKA
jgi:hypothetical protein